MDQDNIELAVEKASLLQDRWYLILKNDSEDTLQMTAYDTTPEESEDEEYIPAGSVILSGLVELMESDMERVMAAGMARITFLETQQTLMESTGQGPEVEHMPDTNIVKLDFGKKQ